VQGAGGLACGIVGEDLQVLQQHYILLKFRLDYVRFHTFKRVSKSFIV
jgi:hypothetical protein